MAEGKRNISNLVITGFSCFIVGMVVVSPSLASAYFDLTQLTDVDTTGVTDGQVVKFNSTSSEWEAEDDSLGAGGGYNQDLNITDSPTFLDITLTNFPNLDKNSSNDFSGSWNDLTNVPSGFADGVDNTSEGSYLWLNGSNADQDINISGYNLTVGWLYTGVTEGDNGIFFFENGNPTNEAIYWMDASDRFYITDRVDVGGTVQGSMLVSTGMIMGYGDIVTTGPGDDLWLGDSVETNTVFRAYANGTLQCVNITANETSSKNISCDRINSSDWTNISIVESQILDLDHYTDADISGSESAFDGWDKDDSDDITLETDPWFNTSFAYTILSSWASDWNASYSWGDHSGLYALINHLHPFNYSGYNQDLNTTSAVTFDTVNTGQGANELYDMNQNVLISSNVKFENITGTEFHLTNTTYTWDIYIDVNGTLIWELE